MHDIIFRMEIEKNIFHMNIAEQCMLVPCNYQYNNLARILEGVLLFPQRYYELLNDST